MDPDVGVRDHDVEGHPDPRRRRARRAERWSGCRSVRTQTGCERADGGDRDPDAGRVDLSDLGRRARRLLSATTPRDENR